MYSYLIYTAVTCFCNFQVALAIATVVAVVLYRMSVLAALGVYGGIVDNSSATLFTTTTAACINLVCIVIFNWVSLYNFINLYNRKT